MSKYINLQFGNTAGNTAIEADDNNDANIQIEKKEFRKSGLISSESKVQSFRHMLKVYRDKLVQRVDFESWDAVGQKKFFHKGALFILGIFGFAAAVFGIGTEHTLPHGQLWACFITWFCAILMGKLFKYLDAPPLLGQLISGIILRNFPYNPVQGLTSAYSAKIRAIGLSLILMRSGLEIDIAQVAEQGFVAARLTALPGISEALATAGAAVFLFGMPFTLAISLGFILAAVSPAVVVSGMFDLQAKGLGVDKGIPSLVVAAASCDDVVAISGFSMFIGMAIPTGENEILSGMHGPINLIAGAFFGVVGGLLCGCTRFWNKPWKRTAVVLCVGLFYMMFADYWHFGGGGALAGLTMTVVAAKCWETAYCGHWSLPANDHWHHEVEHDVAVIWTNFAQPLLFGSIGASVWMPDITSDVDSLWKAVVVIFIGVCVRTPVAMGAVLGKDFSWKEHVFIGLSWVPKATVQAALCAKPLHLVHQYMNHDDEDYEDFEKWGKNILVTAVLSILITAPIGLIAISTLGPLWLNYTPPEEKKTEAWVKNEAVKRIDAEEVAQNNKRESANFFHQLQEELDFIVNACIHPEEHHGEDEVHSSVNKILEGIDALHDTIDAQEESFPVAKLFSSGHKMYGQFTKPEQLVATLRSRNNSMASDAGSPGPGTPGSVELTKRNVSIKDKV